MRKNNYEQEGQWHCVIFLQCGAFKIDRTYNKSLVQTTQNGQKNILMETLSKDFKSIALEIYKFEKQHNKNIDWTFSHVRPNSISETQSEVVLPKKHFETLYHLFRS